MTMITHRHSQQRAAKRRLRIGVRRRRAERRGVLILVVLSLLVLFLLIGVAFVLSSGQFQSSSRAASEMDRTGSSPRVLLEDAMHQLLRDTLNPQSVIRSHSLLRDMYGDDGFKGTFASGAYVSGTGDQLLDVTISANGWGINVPFVATGPTALTLSTVPGAYAGCVMTVVSGAGRGVSMRILDYNPATLTFRVLPINGTVVPGGLSAARFVVNGRPFNGTGPGFVAPTVSGGNLTLGRCNAVQNTPRGFSLRLQFWPNRRRDGVNLATAYLQGGLDESYDAPDLNNMFLGAVFTNAAGNVLPYTAASPGTIIPSFHRRELLEYHESAAGVSDLLSVNVGREDRNLWSLRPSKPDELYMYPDVVHALAPAPRSKESARLLDVDNDGDGIADSVWLDLGYPVQMGPRGAFVKPLFAILCIDLDGRINLNAHGNRSHYGTIPTAQALAAAASTGTMPAGQGLGPAEINLERYLNQAPLSLDISSQILLEGNGSWPGRYGVGGTAAMPGVNGYDVLSVTKFYDYPANSFNPGGRGLRAFGMPADLHGRLGYGLGVRGQILYDQLAAGDDDLTDNPYEINLNQNAVQGAERIQQSDMPFSPAELERVLRFADTDATELPSRLWDMLGAAVNSGAAAAQLRRSLTIASFDVPAPHVLPTPDHQDLYAATPATTPLVPLHITELLRIKLLNGGVTAGNVNAQINLMLSPDLLRGTRMDLNRPFGNAFDDNGNGQVDEPLEPSETWTYGVPGAAPATVTFDYSSPGGATNNILAKQLFARHLYVLAMTLKDRNANIDFDGDGSTTAAETARGLAQWAINTVDFRDADSIMTPFEFDLDPLNGWDVDGDISSTSTDNVHADRAVVWGCERPELLLTETMAFHNRNTTDTNTAGAGDDFATTHTPTAGSDTTFDQEKRPQGTLMVELYNPWMGDVALPSELYNSGGVQLNKLAGTTPVWRMLIVGGASKGRDPEDPVPANQLAAGDVERSIYFTQPAGAVGSDGTQYFPSATVSGAFTGSVISVPPGSYAVVGSAGTINAGNYDSPIGQRIDGLAAGQRTIRLTPPTMSTQLVVSNAATPADPVPPRPVIAVPIDSPRSVSVSEPVGNYDFLTSTETGGIITPPLPQPLDATPLFGGDTDLMQNGTVAHHRTIYLQRLANPLIDYDPDTNPYLTIDMMPINLTRFNGASNDPEPGALIPPNDPDTANNNFTTVERGANNDTATAYNLWRREPLAAALGTSSVGATNDHYYNMVLKHTLGFLNRAFGPTPSVAVGDTGAPAQPFPLLNWNNRPYASQYELLQVPFSRSSRLMIDYPAVQASFSNAYTTNAGWFGNRLNFMLSSVFPVSPGAPTRRPELFRLLDYTHVPSRFLGTDYELNPATFASVAGLRPPFNRVSAYREPGKVNVNTIYSQAIWDAILDGHTGPTFDQLVDSRRGYGTAGSGIVVPNTAFPTYFVNPFRSADANVMVPLPTMEKANPIDCTLLRAGATAGTPLFPPPTGAAAGLFNTPVRNSKFAYEGVERIANLVTTHSNVYAVWITMGYFEVSYSIQSTQTSGVPTNIVVNPTGPFYLGRELDSDVGAQKRSRAFYIIDRSIPVAFEPGQNNNVDNAVLLKRYIE